MNKYIITNRNKYTMAQLARKFNTSVSTVNNILTSHDTIKRYGRMYKFLEPRVGRKAAMSICKRVTRLIDNINDDLGTNYSHNRHLKYLIETGTLDLDHYASGIGPAGKIMIYEFLLFGDNK